ncbi:PKD domain-containing protein [Acidobacteriota bacterium]
MKKNCPYRLAVLIIFVLSWGDLTHSSTSEEKQRPGDGTVEAWCKHGSLQIPLYSTRRGPIPPPQSHLLAVYYAIPSNLNYRSRVHNRIKEATQDIAAWYQCATGGLSWEYALPGVVEVYYAEEPWQYYRDNENWWGSLLSEMRSNGLPIWSPGRVVAVWAQGAGWWGGAAQGCGTDCGVALLGVDLFPEFNNPTFSGGDCPGGTGVNAWPCTPEGAYAHELGHTIGLMHPLDVPETQIVAPHSIMQTHWNYPVYAPPAESPWGFLTLERQTQLTNQFMVKHIDLFQTHDCDVVNLPHNGPVPTAAFSMGTSAGDPTISLTNSSSGAGLYYWTFGDGRVSNEESPMHTYGSPGSYTVTLRASSNASMMDRADDVTVITEEDCLAHLGPVIGLKMTKSSGEVQASWTAEPGAEDGYFLYSLNDKTLIPSANRAGTPRLRECATSRPDATSCQGLTPADGPGGTLLCYQVLGVCDGDREGPVR